jgi:flavin reductase (DIM6/NTAB) family NADH-FMN oxidoreductase RutF
MTDQDPQRQLAAALGRVPSGLFILTARNGNAETGMLASWVQQCSFEPPQISVAIKREREIATWLPEGAAFTLNILEDGQTDMIVHFGRGFPLTADAFAGLEIERPTESGCPVLAEALAYLECRVAGRFAAGDHDIFLGRVVGGRLLSEGHPIIHVRKNGLHY